MSKRKTLRVRITKSSGRFYWYAEMIGAEFNVVESRKRVGDYMVKDDDSDPLKDPVQRLIAKADCELVTTNAAAVEKPFTFKESQS